MCIQEISREIQRLRCELVTLEKVSINTKQKYRKCAIRLDQLKKIQKKYIN
jgi:hypothetical protein